MCIRDRNVHAAQRSHGEHLIGQDAAVGGNTEDLGLGSAQGVDESFDAQAGRTTDPLDLIGAGEDVYKRQL